MQSSKTTAPKIPNPRPKLWQGNSSGSAKTNLQCAKMPPHILPETEESFHWCRSAHRSQLISSTNVKITLQSSLTPSLLYRYIYKSMVISQEAALSTAFLAGCRCLVCITAKDIDERSCRPCAEGSNAVNACSMMVALLIMMIYCSLRSVSCSKIIEMTRNTSNVLSVNAILVAGIIKLVPSTVRILTVSISSDIVTALAVGGLLLHVLTCDYRYANGRNKKRNDTELKGTSLEETHDQRMGGTFSLHCVCFSATLLASWLSSDCYFYIVVIGSVVVFALLPVTQSSFASTTGADSSTMLSLLVTLVLVSTSLLLLDNGLEKIIFLSIISLISIISPIWKWWLYQYKESTSGPWDIAHIDVKG